MDEQRSSDLLPEEEQDIEGHARGAERASAAPDEERASLANDEGDVEGHMRGKKLSDESESRSGAVSDQGDDFEAHRATNRAKS